MRDNGYKFNIILGVILFIFITFSNPVSGQEIKDYCPANVCLTYANGEVIEDIWEVGYGFDNLNDLVYFNMRPNETEEFTIIHKIYNIIDSFDNKNRLVKSDYYLDDLAILLIHLVYDNSEDPLIPTGYQVKLTETLPYSIRKTDIKTIEFNFFIYF